VHISPPIVSNVCQRGDSPRFYLLTIHPRKQERRHKTRGGLAELLWSLSTDFFSGDGAWQKFLEQSRASLITSTYLPPCLLFSVASCRTCTCTDTDTNPLLVRRRTNTSRGVVFFNLRNACVAPPEEGRKREREIRLRDNPASLVRLERGRI